MEIVVKVKTIREIVKALGADAHRLGASEWKYSGANRKPDELAEIRLDDLGVAQLEIVRNTMKANGEANISRVSKLLNALRDPANRPVRSLRELPRMLTEYLRGNKFPWLFSLQTERKGVAYLPVSVEHHVAEHRTREEYVTLSLGYNTKSAFKLHGVTFFSHNLNATVPALLKEKNLMVPDEEMIAEYQKQIARYEQFGGMQGEQFYVRKTGWEAGKSDWWWSSSEVQLTEHGRPTKAVLDMESLKDRDSTRSVYPSGISQKTQRVPTHPVLHLFSLSAHVNVWVNVSNMRVYKYETGLKDRLVLPESHVRLIGALVSNLDVLRSEAEAEDRSRTIRAKAKSSVILAKGPAGTGKTLTAEVYAEEIGRPLYEVQSGQIGVEPEEIEERLKLVLDRSVRLRMPLLINEADVFVQSRGRDLVQNAVVSVFLRLLEYHDGLVFLTTNRADDVDAAILSRCIAEITYGVPAEDERARLWTVLLAEFNVKLSERDIKRAALLFPKAVGRDIQNLIRLTSRVCRATGDDFTLKALADNAVFRSLEVEQSRAAAWFKPKEE